MKSTVERDLTKSDIEVPPIIPLLEYYFSVSYN